MKKTLIPALYILDGYYLYFVRKNDSEIDVYSSTYLSNQMC